VRSLQVKNYIIFSTNFMIGECLGFEYKTQAPHSTVPPNLRPRFPEAADFYDLP